MQIINNIINSMGLCCSRSSTTRVVKVGKILKRPLENEAHMFGHINGIQVKKFSGKKIRKLNYFYVIQRNSWKIILDFLPYKDLRQVGRVNKYLLI